MPDPVLTAQTAMTGLFDLIIVFFVPIKTKSAPAALTIAAFSDGKIVGLAGFERKVAFLRSLIMITNG